MTVLTKLKKETEKRGDLLDKYEVTHIDDLSGKDKYKRAWKVILKVGAIKRVASAILKR